AEAQEALAVCAESGTRQTRHASVVQQTIRQLATREACPGNVRKGIEGSVRLETAHAWQRIQTGDDGRSASGELPEHAVDGFLRTFERSDSRLLREARRTA